MKRIATLLTCYNRKLKTMACLDVLFHAFDTSSAEVEVVVFLTDDGTDGTAQIIKEQFFDRDIHLLQGTGDLYWTGGMRNSWKEAIKEGGFDGYLWLNDDAFVFPDLVSKLISADLFCRDKYKTGGIYVGSTCDHTHSKCTYGGLRLNNNFLNTGCLLTPNDEYQNCDMSHGNITYVSADVVDKIGVFHDGYKHGYADFGYTFLAKKKNLPLFVLPGFLGVCDNDHDKFYAKFVKLNFRERVASLYSPLGLQFEGYLLFQREFFPYRYPFVLLSGWFKVLFPKSYLRLNRFRSLG